MPHGGRERCLRGGLGVMIAAIYARKSTDQSAVADEAKSVTRQIDHATAYATVRLDRAPVVHLRG
jgi:hypothetical protein